MLAKLAAHLEPQRRLLLLIDCILQLCKRRTRVASAPQHPHHRLEPVGGAAVAPSPLGDVGRSRETLRLD